MKQGRGQRQKGAVAEREVAAILEELWGEVEPGVRFVRTPGSGGWGTGQLRSEFQASGDLMTTAARFPFCVEVKRREAWSLDNVKAGKRSPIWGWWAQTKEAAKEAAKEPLLFFRKGGSSWLVIVPVSVEVVGWSLEIDVPGVVEELGMGAERVRLTKPVILFAEASRRRWIAPPG